MANSTFFDRFNNWVKGSITLRLFTIGFLVLILLIPVSMVESMISERQYRHEEAIREVSSKWGETQTLVGPVLTVPFYSYSRVYDEDEPQKYRLVRQREYAHFLPEQLEIEGEIMPEVRYRGIYEVVVYNSRLRVEGEFPAISFGPWTGEDEREIRWEEAFLAVGLSDLRSIQAGIEVKWGDQSIPFQPGLESNDVLDPGISTRVPLNEGEGKHAFSLELDFNGSSGLFFTPLGKETHASLRADWPDPGFDGAFLPDEREVTAEGFTANWKVLHLNRPYPQQFQGRVGGIASSAFGVNLVMPVDEYQKNMRSAKYAVLIISLTFLVFFFMQILKGVRIHFVQYLLVGLALCVFYVLLLSISEHLGFTQAYLIASLATTALISGYTVTMVKTRKLTGLLTLLLFFLYAYLFTLLQLQDYALLMGAVGLFLTLAVVMYLSRKIDWFGGE